VAQVGLLLGTAETLTLLCLGFLLTLVGLSVGLGLRALCLALGDPLGLALLIRGSFCLRLGFGFGGLLRLLALDFGIFGGVPRVEDLTSRYVSSSGVQDSWRRDSRKAGTHIAVLGLFVVKLPARGSRDWRVRGRAGLLLLFLCKRAYVSSTVIGGYHQETAPKYASQSIPDTMACRRASASRAHPAGRDAPWRRRCEKVALLESRGQKGRNG
jgi:hypothetical protein